MTVSHSRCCVFGRCTHDQRAAKKKADELAVQPFALYTLHHTCLTRWAPHVDPSTLAHLAGIRAWLSRKLLDLDHALRVEQLEAAFAALKTRLTVDIQQHTAA